MSDATASANGILIASPTSAKSRTARATPTRRAGGSVGGRETVGKRGVEIEAVGKAANEENGKIKRRP